MGCLASVWNYSGPPHLWPSSEWPALPCNAMIVCWMLISWPAFMAICTVSLTHGCILRFCPNLAFIAKTAHIWTIGSLYSWGVYLTTMLFSLQPQVLFYDCHVCLTKIAKRLIKLNWSYGCPAWRLSWLMTVVDRLHYSHKLRITCIFPSINTLLSTL